MFENGKSIFTSALSLAQTTGASLMLLHVISSSESDSTLPPEVNTQRESIVNQKELKNV
ncbi:hypothetical protein IQ255_13930 [Pleurocapsales cyanobacterium LEGE 10410]|nr:hypothetical protein [Pleurocapsales cyanobacterium LEGE 10410]